MTHFDPWQKGRIVAVVGHYGSGKTEIALALALAAAREGRAVKVVDLDIVNPFFRSADQEAALRERGVGLIAPPYAGTGVDLPVVSAQVQSIFDSPDISAVIDVGGEEAGAAALGRYRPHFDRTGCALYYVVNLFRPFSQTGGQIEAQMARIAARARLKPAGLINNSNLGPWTEPEHLMEGQRVLAQVSQRTGVPIVAVSGEARVLSALKEPPAPVIEIEQMLKPEWMD
jgi:energy-coupling factor transporter ATP-binding protein EcfA2